MKKWVLASLLLATATSGHSATVFADFDAVSYGALVDEFYNGGTDSAGVNGPKLLLSFTNFITATGFGETTKPHLAYNVSSTAIISFVRGFSRVEVDYGAFGAGTLSAYSLPGGAGQELARQDLAINNPYAFSALAFQFAGQAQSLVLRSERAQIGIDNLRLTDALFTAVPEPQSWIMLMAGFAAMGSAIRRPRLRRNRLIPG